MREIKFRAWDHVDSVMLFADIGELQYIGGEWTAWDLPIESPTNTGMPFEIMQFTGLTDKSGVEIYEGDIIYHHGAALEIKWHDEYCKYVLSKPHGWLTKFKAELSEVIGNIHQNKELLK